MSKRIAIVGAGVGALATAARLAYRGYQVEAYEKLPACGGRNNLIEDRGFKFDTGPSFILMPDFFEEVFSYCGKSLKDYLDLRAVDPSYKIFYPDGESLAVYKDSLRTKEELERIEKGASLAFDKFIAETARLYKLTRPLLYRCFTPASLFNPRYFSLIGRMDIFDSYWQLARRFFKSDKLCYTFTFEAMFMGVSPYEAPAFYSIISYADHVQKIYHPMGGMYQVPLALERLAKESGAKFNYNSAVERIENINGRLRLKIGQTDIGADSVVANADYAYAQERLLNRRLPKYRYSCSVYLVYLGLKKKVAGAAHHNLFFAGDLQKNLKQIFKGKAIPMDPSFYLHVPTVTDPSLAPGGKDLFYILVPVPNLEGPGEDIKEKEGILRKVVFDRINKALGINLEELIEVEHRFHPEDFIKRYNIKNGATFGLAHNLMQSAFFRPANFDSRIKNLYYVGASTQPGGGLPVVIAGSRIVAGLIG